MDWKKIRLWTAAGVSFVVAILVTGLLLVDLGSPPDALLFIGRFHPMIVHFPIGLLVLAALLEGFAVLRPLRSLRYVTTFVLFLGAVSSVAAVVAGLMLSLEGGYDPLLMSQHRSLGIVVAIGAVLATLLRARARPSRSRAEARVYAGVLVGTVAALLGAGHLGGSLTHGAGYLTYYMPVSVKRIAGIDGARTRTGQIADIDSAVVYADLVAPILQTRCVGCHSADKRKGGLRLDSLAHLLRGGDSGPALVAGLPDESELLRRVILPPSHEDAMPPDGAPALSIGETELIRWWIAHGASPKARVADIEEVPSSVTTLFTRMVGPRTEKKMGVYALQVAPADPRAVAALRSAGYGVEPVSGDLPLLQVTTVNVQRSFGDDDLRRLNSVAGQITWLDLTGTAVTDRGLAAVSRMPNLTRLSLARTTITDAGTTHLAGLKNLEYLNLYGTAVSDSGLARLESLPRLRRLYLWQTKATEEGVERLRARHPEIEAVLTVGEARPES